MTSLPLLTILMPRKPHKLANCLLIALRNHRALTNIALMNLFALTNVAPINIPLIKLIALLAPPAVPFPAKSLPNLSKQLHKTGLTNKAQSSPNTSKRLRFLRRSGWTSRRRVRENWSTSKRRMRWWSVDYWAKITASSLTFRAQIRWPRVSRLYALSGRSFRCPGGRICAAAVIILLISRELKSLWVAL